MTRDSRIAFSDDELERLKKAKEDRGLGELPHAAFILRVLEGDE